MNEYIGLTIRNPLKQAELIFCPFELKPLTWAAKRRYELIKLRNKRIKLKKQILLTLITILLILPITLIIAFIPSIIFKGLNESSVLLWSLCSGMLGYIMFLKIEDLLDI